ncbi:MmyB family transcriptional regulator [Streptomyces sp. NPDC054813]
MRDTVRGDDDALARALNFSAEESRHLHSLAAAARIPARPPRTYEPEEVPDTTRRLLRTMTSPALVVGRFLDVLAWNPLGGALLGEFTRRPQPQPQRERERNLLALFLHPEADRACPNRAATVAELIGMLRTQVAADPGNPRAVKLVGELAVAWNACRAVGRAAGAQFGRRSAVLAAEPHRGGWLAVCCRVAQGGRSGSSGGLRRRLHRAGPPARRRPSNGLPHRGVLRVHVGRHRHHVA